MFAFASPVLVLPSPCRAVWALLSNQQGAPPAIFTIALPHTHALTTRALAACPRTCRLPTHSLPARALAACRTHPPLPCPCIPNLTLCVSIPNHTMPSRLQPVLSLTLTLPPPLSHLHMSVMHSCTYIHTHSRVHSPDPAGFGHQASATRLRPPGFSHQASATTPNSLLTTPGFGHHHPASATSYD